MFRTTLSAAAEYYEQTPPKGEFVLIIDGKQEEEEVCSLENAAELAGKLMEGGKDVLNKAEDYIDMAEKKMF